MYTYTCIYRKIPSERPPLPQHWNDKIKPGGRIHGSALLHIVHADGTQSRRKIQGGGGGYTSGGALTVLYGTCIQLCS